MKASFRVVLALGVLTLAVATAGAQQQKGRGFGGGFGGGQQGGLTNIAANEAVQKELGVSGDVTSKLTALRDDYRAAQQKEYQTAGIDPQNFQNLTPEQRQKMTAIGAKLNDEFTGKIKELVSADQLKRLKQIQIQVQGSAALTNPDVATELKISDDQRKQLIELGTEFGRKQRELFTGGGSFQENAGKMRELATERDNKALALLNAEQKEKFTALKGSPFDTAQIGFGGAGRGKRGKN